MTERIHTNHVVKVIDNTSPYFEETGDVLRFVNKPVRLRLTKHILVKLHSSTNEELFLPAQLEVIGEK